MDVVDFLQAKYNFSQPQGLVSGFDSQIPRLLIIV